MSLSTFKRHFIKEHKTSPGKWLQDKRLQKAKETLELDNLKPSDMYWIMAITIFPTLLLTLKNKFGINPSEITS